MKNQSFLKNWYKAIVKENSIARNIIKNIIFLKF